MDSVFLDLLPVSISWVDFLDFGAVAQPFTTPPWVGYYEEVEWGLDQGLCTAVGVNFDGEAILISVSFALQHVIL